MRKCSFCGKKEKEVEKLIVAGEVAVCSECIALFNDMAEAEQPEITNEKLPVPKEIKKTLDDYVISQEAAKKALAVSVYNHYRRALEPGKDDFELQKSNVLLIGPTG